MRTIVVSAVNLNVGGTLTILRECLGYLSELAKSSGEFHVVALVHKKELAFYENIEYIELPWSKKCWVNRIWCEYVTMNRISRELFPVYLWLSLHDTTPNVQAIKRAVYCHNPFPFYQWKWRDLFFNYKIVLFSWFSSYIYRINIYKNDYIVLQQQWIREEFRRMFSLRRERIIVAPPQPLHWGLKTKKNFFLNKCCFFYPSSPNLHKNFESLCEASRLLENEVGKGRFTVVLSVRGDENKYASWLKKKWGEVESIDFAGFMSRERLYGYYQAADCLVFPSKVETWGLPISEFMETGKPMLLADLPYAHETSAGSECTAFFSATDVVELKNEMKKILEGDWTSLKKIPLLTGEEPIAYTWKELFEKLVKE